MTDNVNNQDEMAFEYRPIPPLPDIAAQQVVQSGHRIALLINDVVYQIMVVGDDQAALFLANPKFVRVPPRTFVAPGDKWDGTQFVGE